jgi:hypothetical protein
VTIRKFASSWNRGDANSARGEMGLRVRSEILVVMPRFTVETSDTPEALRELSQQVQVEELSHRQ